MVILDSWERDCFLGGGRAEEYAANLWCGVGEAALGVRWSAWLLVWEWRDMKLTGGMVIEVMVKFEGQFLAERG